MEPEVTISDAMTRMILAILQIEQQRDKLGNMVLIKYDQSMLAGIVDQLKEDIINVNR